MVLDNDDAKKRQGVDVTYKKKCGFQPLQITWCGKIVDALFRRGSAHSNHGSDVKTMMKDIVTLIRTRYCPNVPIVLTTDSGFMDERISIILKTCSRYFTSAMVNFTTVSKNPLRKHH